MQLNSLSFKAHIIYIPTCLFVLGLLLQGSLKYHIILYTGLLKMVVTPCQKGFLDTFMANKTYILECYKPVLF